MGYHYFWKHLQYLVQFAVCQNLGIQHIQSPDPFLALILKSYCVYQDISWLRVSPESSKPPWFCIQCQQAWKPWNKWNPQTWIQYPPVNQRTNMAIKKITMFNKETYLYIVDDPFPSYFTSVVYIYICLMLRALLHHNFTTKSNGYNRTNTCNGTHLFTVFFLWGMIQKTNIWVLKIDHNTLICQATLQSSWLENTWTTESYQLVISYCLIYHGFYRVYQITPKKHKSNERSIKVPRKKSSIFSEKSHTTF